jgi:hypothetical protein
VTATANFLKPRAKMVTVGGGSSERDAPSVCPLKKDHSFTCARGEQAKWLRGAQEKRRSSVMQDDKLPPAVFRRRLAWPQLPRRCPEGQGKEVHLFFDTGSNHSFTCMWTRRREEVSRLRASRRNVGHQRCKMTNCRRTFSKMACVTATAQCVP